MKLFTKKCTSNKTNTCLYKKYTEKNINKKHIKEHKMNEIIKKGWRMLLSLKKQKSVKTYFPEKKQTRYQS